VAAVITSRKNPLVVDLRTSLRSPGRAAGRVLVEGWRVVDAAVASGARFEVAVYTPEAAADRRRVALRDRVRSLGAREAVVTPEVFAALTQVESPQGVLGVVVRPAGAPPLATPNALVVVLDGIQDPGNVGTIVRTAAAVGATAAVTVGNAADPFGAKALRASAGAAFRLPPVHFSAAATAAAELRGLGIRLVIADPRGDRPVAEVSFARPLALVFGNEGSGADAAWRHAGAETVRLPIADAVESLNVAAAAAVLLYRAAGLG